MQNLIIGGAGFIGSNVASKLLQKNEKVIILDNLSRRGSEKNLAWLQKNFGNSLKFVQADISKDIQLLNDSMNGTDRIYCLAGQVAVTSSVENPRHDFEANALGTFNVLESMRQHAPKTCALIYSSTNKVYGEMENLKIDETSSGYKYADLPNGIDENMPLDFHSPYGCSKGTGDQYVRDYARIYGLNTVVFRQSCIYGPRQFGVEDQGWVAWFIIALLQNKKITIYGDGKQVRDILYIDDLINAYELAFTNIEKTKGEIFNIGGGPRNVISIWQDFKPILEELFAKKIEVSYSEWRPGDQKIFVSNVDKARQTFGWEPKYSPKEGISSLYTWAKNNVELFN